MARNKDSLSRRAHAQYRYDVRRCWRLHSLRASTWPCACTPGGHLIISTFGPQGPERCSGLPVARYDANALAAQLGPEFELLNSSLGVHKTPWGAEQQFLYCHFRVSAGSVFG